jgi:hypothetical protein
MVAAQWQESLLRQRGKTNPNPCKHFRLDLHQFLQKQRQDSNKIILTGDFNKTLGDKPDGVVKLCSVFTVFRVVTDQWRKHRPVGHERKQGCSTILPTSWAWSSLRPRHVY